jgi:hypothetical protein
MCNRYRMSAERIEVALRFGIDPALIMPERERLPSPELLPKRTGCVVRKENGARMLDVMTRGFPPPAAARAPVTNVRNLARSLLAIGTEAPGAALHRTCDRVLRMERRERCEEEAPVFGLITRSSPSLGNPAHMPAVSTTSPRS